VISNLFPTLRTARSAVLALTLGFCAAASASTVSFEIDTTPLAGRVGYLAFDLVQGATGRVNQVAVGSFVGTGTLGAATTSGNVVGNLTTTVTLSSSTFFNELLQGVTFAAGLTRFELTFSTLNGPGQTPDEFSFFLLDNLFAPFATTDPTGAGALILIDLQLPTLVQTYTSPWATVTLVPEPSAAAMILWGALGLALVVGQRQRSFARLKRS
jgi:hypothetical protein